MTTGSIGTTDMTRVSRERAWSVGLGNHYVEVWKGPIAAALTLFDDYQGDPDTDSVRMAEDRGVGILTRVVQDDLPGGGGQTNPALDTVWEILPMEIYKPVIQHPTFAGHANQGQLVVIRKAIEAGNAVTPAAGVPTTYYNILIRGTQEYVRSMFVLQKTIEAGRRSAVAAAWTGVDRAWKLSGEANSPDPPSAILGSIADHPDYDADAKQFLKKAPSVRQIARGRFQIVESWWFSYRWSNTLYEGDNEAGNP